jgi:hypothetical protein
VAPHDQTFVRQALDRPAHRGPGEAQGFGEVDLVEKQASGGQLPLIDGLLEVLSDLKVQRHRAGAVQ